MARSIFALEMCLRFDATFVEGVRAMLTADTQNPSPGQLWQMWSATAFEIRRRRAAWVSGCWDFWDDDKKAQTDFRKWVEGLMTEEGARQKPAGSQGPYRSSERFMTITFACLLVKLTAAERALATVCEIPDAYLWHASTFDTVLTGIPNINFAVVDRATLYLLPKEEDWALTPEDMRLSKFDYLRPIV